MIEGIHRAPTEPELHAHKQLWAEKELTVKAVENFVSVIAPGALLRDAAGLDVTVGDYSPPPGGPWIREKLWRLLHSINDGERLPHGAHLAYERLHPFTDGNGRSGRAIWAWHMERKRKGAFELTFLHRFYYQTLGSR